MHNKQARLEASYVQLLVDQLLYPISLEYNHFSNIYWCIINAYWTGSSSVVAGSNDVNTIMCKDGVRSRHHSFCGTT